MRRVLILEDDSAMSEWLESAIHREMADLRPEIEVLETESEFVLKWLPEFDKGLREKPAVIVIDVMLRWTDPDPDQPPRPPEVIDGGFMRAGLRCLDLIRKHTTLSRSRVVLFTNLSKENLESIGGNADDVEFVQKDDALVVLRRIRAALTRVPSSPSA
jgi:CheY-like chemotaxis protein